MLNLKALKEAAEKATPGEWWCLGRTISAVGSVDTFSGAVHGVIATAEPCVQQDSDGRTWSARGDELSNAAFIALANPSTILSLIERCEELEGVLSTIDAVAPDLPDALWNQIDAALSKADATS